MGPPPELTAAERERQRHVRMARRQEMARATRAWKYVAGCLLQRTMGPFGGHYEGESNSWSMLEVFAAAPAIPGTDAARLLRMLKQAAPAAQRLLRSSTEMDASPPTPSAVSLNSGVNIDVLLKINERLNAQRSVHRAGVYAPDRVGRDVEADLAALGAALGTVSTEQLAVWSPVGAPPTRQSMMMNNVSASFASKCVRCEQMSQAVHDTAREWLTQQAAIRAKASSVRTLGAPLHAQPSFRQLFDLCTQTRSLFARFRTMSPGMVRICSWVWFSAWLVQEQGVVMEHRLRQTQTLSEMLLTLEREPMAQRQCMAPDDYTTVRMWLDSMAGKDWWLHVPKAKTARCVQLVNILRTRYTTDLARWSAMPNSEALETRRQRDVLGAVNQAMHGILTTASLDTQGSATCANSNVVVFLGEQCDLTEFVCLFAAVVLLAEMGESEHLSKWLWGLFMNMTEKAQWGTRMSAWCSTVRATIAERQKDVAILHGDWTGEEVLRSVPSVRHVARAMATIHASRPRRGAHREPMLVAVGGDSPVAPGAGTEHTAKPDPKGGTDTDDERKTVSPTPPVDTAGSVHPEAPMDTGDSADLLDLAEPQGCAATPLFWASDPDLDTSPGSGEGGATANKAVDVVDTRLLDDEYTGALSMEVMDALPWFHAMRSMCKFANAEAIVPVYARMPGVVPHESRVEKLPLAFQALSSKKISQLAPVFGMQEVEPGQEPPPAAAPTPTKAIRTQAGVEFTVGGYVSDDPSSDDDSNSSHASEHAHVPDIIPQCSALLSTHLPKPGTTSDTSISLFKLFHSMGVVDGISVQKTLQAATAKLQRHWPSAIRSYLESGGSGGMVSLESTNYFVSTTDTLMDIQWNIELVGVRLGGDSEHGYLLNRTVERFDADGMPTRSHRSKRKRSSLGTCRIRPKRRMFALPKCVLVPGMQTQVPTVAFIEWMHSLQRAFEVRTKGVYKKLLVHMDRPVTTLDLERDLDGSLSLASLETRSISGSNFSVFSRGSWGSLSTLSAPLSTDSGDGSGMASSGYSSRRSHGLSAHMVDAHFVAEEDARGLLARVLNRAPSELEIKALVSQTNAVPCDAEECESTVSASNVGANCNLVCVRCARAWGVAMTQHRLLMDALRELAALRDRGVPAASDKELKQVDMGNLTPMANEQCLHVTHGGLSDVRTAQSLLHRSRVPISKSHNIVAIPSPDLVVERMCLHWIHENVVYLETSALERQAVDNTQPMYERVTRRLLRQHLSDFMQTAFSQRGSGISDETLASVMLKCFNVPLLGRSKKGEFGNAALPTYEFNPGRSPMGVSDLLAMRDMDTFMSAGVPVVAFGDDGEDEEDSGDSNDASGGDDVSDVDDAGGDDPFADEAGTRADVDIDVFTTAMGENGSGSGSGSGSGHDGGSLHATSVNTVASTRTPRETQQHKAPTPGLVSKTLMAAHRKTQHIRAVLKDHVFHTRNGLWGDDLADALWKDWVDLMDMLPEVYERSKEFTCIPKEKQQGAFRTAMKRLKWGKEDRHKFPCVVVDTKLMFHRNRKRLSSWLHSGRVCLRCPKSRQCIRPAHFQVK